MATISKENYLKAIYGIAGLNNNIVPLSALANEMGVSNAAISEMANKLSRQGYIDYKKYKGIKILGKGKKLAIDVIRKHRLWEIFLIETLGLNWGEVHHEAEILEHSTTDFLIDKIDEYLNFPKTDPHGAPVPNKEGIYRSNDSTLPMSECTVGKKYKIARVNDKNPELISYLSQLKISLNKQILISNKLTFDNSVIIGVDGVSHSLSEKLVNNIYLSELKD